MWWKFFTELVFGPFLGSVAVVSLLLAVHEERKDSRSVFRDYSAHSLRNLTAKEINHRTLKAAAAIDRLHRRYKGAVTTTGPFAELKVPFTKELMGTNAGHIALFKNQHGALPATLDEVASGSPETVMFSMMDAWITEFKYVPKKDGRFQLVSAGPDKVFGTSDDIHETF
jgi:hypothetical protein